MTNEIYIDNENKTTVRNVINTCIYILEHNILLLVYYNNNKKKKLMMKKCLKYGSLSTSLNNTADHYTYTYRV